MLPQEMQELNKKIIGLMFFIGLTLASCASSPELYLPPTAKASFATSSPFAQSPLPQPSPETTLATELPPTTIPLVSPGPDPTQSSDADDSTAIVSWYLTEEAAVLSATPEPYWDLLPLQSTPEGGWKTYTNTRYQLAFEYPAQYDTGTCGKLRVSESDQETGIYFEGGTISISIVKTGEVDLAEYVNRVIDERDYLLLSTIDEFWIDGVPALRFIRIIGAITAAQYEKRAFVLYKGYLYWFQYSFRNFVWCDAVPLSEEAVYEHLISTWQFLQ